MSDKLLSEITPQDIEAARLSLEDRLIDMRDGRSWLQEGGTYHGHGLVVREYDGSASSLIRIPTRIAIEMAIEAIRNRS